MFGHKQGKYENEEPSSANKGNEEIRRRKFGVGNRADIFILAESSLEASSKIHQGVALKLVSAELSSWAAPRPQLRSLLRVWTLTPIG